MKTYTANTSVIYTNEEGNRFDTFVIFDTDLFTGITHINHQNLKVTADALELHTKTMCADHLPMDDAFSFQLFDKLREKYGKLGRETQMPDKSRVIELNDWAKTGAA